MSACTCRACGDVFGSLGAFERHRVGKLTQHGPDYGRRCLPEAEMLALGWHRDANGRWRTKCLDENAICSLNHRARFNADGLGGLAVQDGNLRGAMADTRDEVGLTR